MSFQHLPLLVIANLGAAISLVLMVMILLCMSITNQFGDEEKGEMLK